MTSFLVCRADTALPALDHNTQQRLGLPQTSTHSEEQQAQGCGKYGRVAMGEGHSMLFAVQGV